VTRREARRIIRREAANLIQDAICCAVDSRLFLDKDGARYSEVDSERIKIAAREFVERARQSPREG